MMLSCDCFLTRNQSFYAIYHRAGFSDTKCLYIERGSEQAMQLSELGSGAGGRGRSPLDVAVLPDQTAILTQIGYGLADNGKDCGWLYEYVVRKTIQTLVSCEQPVKI